MLKTLKVDAVSPKFQKLLLGNRWVPCGRYRTPQFEVGSSYTFTFDKDWFDGGPIISAVKELDENKSGVSAE